MNRCLTSDVTPLALHYSSIYQWNSCSFNFVSILNSCESLTCETDFLGEPSLLPDSV